MGWRVRQPRTRGSEAQFRLQLAAADRLTPQRLRAYVEHPEAAVSPTPVADYVAHLYDCARITATGRDWTWLRALKSRLQGRARPKDRFDRLVPGELTLDLGIGMRLADE